MTAIRESERTNAYWLTVLAKAQEDPEVLDWARDRRADFQSVTKEELEAMARLYFGLGKASRVIIKPYATQQNSLILNKPAETVPNLTPGGPPTPTPTPPPDGM
jgi:zinc protease